MNLQTVNFRFAMKPWMAGLVIGLAMGLPVLGRPSPTPGAYKAEEPPNRSLDATLYMQTAAEYRASCYQVYALATARLGQMVQAAMAKPEPYPKHAVIMDLDETVLDNSHFQAMLLRNRLGWDKDLWATWEKDYSREVGLVPGAKEFVDKAHEWGVDVFYVSNRSEKFRAQAWDALTRLGVPPKDEDHLKLVADPPPAEGNDKTKRFDEVRSGYVVLLYVGDNLRDFDNNLRFAKLATDASNEELERAVTERKDALDRVKSNLGREWIILPNPTYGEWKAPLGRGQRDFDRLSAANFPIPSLVPSNCKFKPCRPARSRTDAFDPAIWTAVIAFVSAAILFFLRKWFERRAINRAILAEIRRIIIVVEKHRKWWADQVEAGDTNYPLIPFSHIVYSKQVGNIGALKNRLVGKAVTFYGYLDFINSLQAARPLYTDAKMREFDERYLKVLTSFVADYKNQFKDFGV